MSETVYPQRVFDFREPRKTVEAIRPQIVHDSTELTVSTEVHGFTVEEDLMDRLLLAAVKPKQKLGRSGK
jgi:hypothetical protein